MRKPRNDLIRPVDEALSRAIAALAEAEVALEHAYGAEWDGTVKVHFAALQKETSETVRDVLSIRQKVWIHHPMQKDP